MGSRLVDNEWIFIAAHPTHLYSVLFAPRMENQWLKQWLRGDRKAGADRNTDLSIQDVSLIIQVSVSTYQSCLTYSFLQLT